MSILFIEPHGDDLLCSASYLLNQNEPVHILTLGHSRNSKELVVFSKEGNLVTTYKDFPEIDYSLFKRTGITTHTINHMFKISVRKTYPYYEEIMCKEFLHNSEFEIPVNLLKEEFSNLDYSKYDRVYLPIGLRHPYHFVVSMIGRDYIPKDKLTFYVDKPYYQARYCQQIKVSFQLGNLLDEIKHPKDGELVKRALKYVYPTEVSMLRFSSEILLEMEDIELTWKTY